MKQALNQAGKALKNDDVPIGAVIVCGGKVIAKAYNQVEMKKDSTAHAETEAIRNAIKKLKYKHLLDCTIYVTLEPCPMCAGAIVLSRISRLVFGACDPKAGASGTLYNITGDKRLNHTCLVNGGIMQDECSEIISNFFKNLRKIKKSADSN